MFCSHCGAHLNDQDRFCNHCGARQEIPAPTQPAQHATQPTIPHPTIPKGKIVKQEKLPTLSWMDFYKSYVHEKWVTWTIVLYFISAVASVILDYILGVDLLVSFLFSGIYVVMAILLITTRHWAFVLLPIAIATINFFLAADASYSLALIMSIRSLVVLTKGKRAYASYKETGEIPDFL